RRATKPLTTDCRPPDSVGGNAVGGWVVEDVDDVADVEDVVEVSGASTVVVVLAGAVVVVAGRATGAPARPQLTASTSTTTAPRAITPCDGTLAVDMRMYGRPDPEELKDAGISKGTLIRAWTFARPYRSMLVLYLVTIIAGTVVGVLPPLVFKSLIDNAIHNKNERLLYFLVAVAAGLTLAQTAIGLINRWFSSRIGEGLIFDLRTALYEH